MHLCLFRAVIMAALLPTSRVFTQDATSRVSELKAVGGVRIAAVYDLDAQPPYAYALERENLRVLDVRDPRRVEEVGNLEFKGPRLRSIIHGSALYMAGWGEPLAVVDISTPKNPRWVGIYPDVMTNTMLVTGNLLYVVGTEVSSNRGHTVYILALTDSASIPSHVGAVFIDHDTTAAVTGLSHDGSHLYLNLQRRNRGGDQLVVIDVRDPSHPRLERRITLPGGPQYRGILVRGNICYTLTNNPTTLTILGLEGSDEAVFLGSATDSTLRSGIEMKLRENILYASFKGDAILATFDVSDPEKPRVLHTFVPEWGDAGLGFSIVEDRLYLSGDAGPSAILDLKIPSAPRYLGRWDYEGGWARQVAIPGRITLVLNWGKGVLIYDAANPNSLNPLGIYRFQGLGDGLDHVAVSGDRMLVSHGPKPSELVDISDPSMPTLVSKLAVPEAVAAAVLTPTHIIQAYAAGGLGILYLSNPEHAISHLALEGEATDIAVRQNLAIVSHLDGGVSAIDIGTPEMPILLGRTAGFAGGDKIYDDMMTRLALSADGTRAFTVRGLLEWGETVTLTAYGLSPRSTPRIFDQLKLEMRGPGPEDFPVITYGNTVLVGAGDVLVEVDAADPQHLTVMSRWHMNISMAANGFALRNHDLFVAAAESGMQVFELPNR